MAMVCARECPYLNSAQAVRGCHVQDDDLGWYWELVRQGAQVLGGCACARRDTVRSLFGDMLDWDDDIHHTCGGNQSSVCSLPRLQWALMNESTKGQESGLVENLGRF